MKFKYILTFSVAVIGLTLGFSESAYSRTYFTCQGPDLFEQHCHRGRCSEWRLVEIKSRQCRNHQHGAHRHRHERREERRDERRYRR